VGKRNAGRWGSPHAIEIRSYFNRDFDKQGKIMPIKRPATGWRVERPTTHPGTILREDFLLPLGISANHLATETRMPATRIGEILHGRRGISTDTALRLSRFFGTSAEFWLSLQSAHDLSKARLELEGTILRDVEPYARPPVSA
jgi:addiction module HigA family antidote